eukprot:CAMPEP_0177200856 /NCGR_PEP_ID=MMETSP0367-20130122/26444_1 /TAXON_ID=447022 ORGANISM="Scrippsiella hangoei-like, Strain SHHI-4" /NCGR_SAMPLE_ID=MMETSP0367 /ASSEMBLY_ACC=CAM_ASM_000362 /LENGTH=120 /DNA_ID=CAMNT_0018649327 /DNA_START=315 /DNA_END=677 /DNA_ORIENTATION=+
MAVQSFHYEFPAEMCHRAGRNHGLLELKSWDIVTRLLRLVRKHPRITSVVSADGALFDRVDQSMQAPDAASGARQHSAAGCSKDIQQSVIHGLQLLSEHGRQRRHATETQGADNDEDPWR